MNYHIRIVGGFAGISQEYKGKVEMSPNEKGQLLKALKSQKLPNPKLRDSIIYKFKFWDKDFDLATEYDESNIPEYLRNIINTLK